MDIVLKRRLIGASILIALAVIFVPMLLVDPEAVDDDGGDPVAVPPMPESAGEVRRIPLDPEAARVEGEQRPGPATAQAPEVTQEPAPTEAEPAAESPPPEHEIVLRPELAADGEQDEAGPANESDDAASPDPASAAEPEARVEEPDSGEATAVEAPSATESGPATTDDAAGPALSLGDFVVQVASFGSAESADGVRTRLEALGHIVFRDEIVRGDVRLYRLRTGPYPTREAAEQAREQIATTVAGVEPIVREIDGAGSGSADAAGFAVQVGVFVGQENAEAETARLSGLGFDAMRFSEQVGERLVWRVVVGPVADREAADALQQRLADEAGVDGLVVSY